MTITPYVTVDEFRDYIGSDTGNKQLTADAAINAACRAIDGHCGRYFYQTTKTEYFTPERGNLWILNLDNMDLADTDGLTVNVEFGLDGTYPESRVFGTDFICEPINQSMNGIEGWPFTRLRAVNGKIWPPRYADFQRDTVKVTGTFGWPTVPDAVVEATKIIANVYFNSGDRPFGTVGINGWGEVKIRDPLAASTATSLLHDYRKSSPMFLMA